MTPSALKTKEIEAKFLVKELPAGWAGQPHNHLKQGYVIAHEEHSLRLRQKGDRFIQTIKMGQGLSRTEVEFDLTESQFSSLWPLTTSRQLSKTRYEIALPDELVAELDIYDGALEGLMTVEVEFNSEEDYYKFKESAVPGWFGQEVTNDARYINQNLAIDGLPNGLP